MLRLRQVTIHRYRSVLPGTHLRFGPGFVFVLGKNGSGKTTLLDLLAKLIAGNLGPLRDEGQPLDVEWELEADVPAGDVPGPERVRGWFRFTLERAESTLPVALPGQAGLTQTLTWRLEGRFSGWKAVEAEGEGAEAELVEDPVGVPLRFVYSSEASPVYEPSMAGLVKPGASSPVPFGPATSVIRTVFGELAQVIFERPDVRDWVSRVLHLDLLVFPHLFRFDEALSTFQRITDARAEDAVMFKVAAGGEGKTVAWPRFLPEELGTDIISEFARLLGRNGAVPLKQPLTELLEAEAIDFIPNESERSNDSITYRGFDIHVTWPGGHRHRHDQLSFGQKRLIAFLWYAAVYHSCPLITDELSNGLHARWVSAILHRLQGQQVFAALQNPLLLDRSGPGSAEEIPGNFVLCEATVAEGRRRWRWRNPTPEEAERLRAAWDAGFQQLSEVLISQGLL